MKVFLMYKDRDFDVQQELPWNEPELTQDLELDTLFQRKPYPRLDIKNGIHTSVFL